MTTSTDTPIDTTAREVALRELVDTHLAAWTETDPVRRAELIQKCWVNDGALVDPPLDGRGTDGISNLMAALQEHYPGHRFVRTSGIDHHHDTLRFSWELRRADGAVVLTGIDVGLLADDGRLTRISGFFADLPAREHSGTAS